MQLDLKRLNLFGNSGILKFLGFANHTRLLIVHADDFGLCASANKGCIAALEGGLVTSASIMVPCEGSAEAINYSVQHPELDIGIHLTLTSEWKTKKWGPVLGTNVPSLTDWEGNFYRSLKNLKKNARLEDVELELQAQIEKAVAMGMKPSHLDSHMFCGIVNPDFLKIYLKLGRHYGIPVLLNRRRTKKMFGYKIDRYIDAHDIVTDTVIIARQRHIEKGLSAFYNKIIQKLEPGLHSIMIHPAYDDNEMKEITSGFTNFNSKWRQTDLDFFTGEVCKTLIKNKNIRLTSWKEIKALYKLPSDKGNS